MSRHQLKRKIGNIERACAVETIVKTKPKSGASTGSPARNQLDRETGKGFLLAELRTGMTFAQLALTAHEFETEKIQRERANARKAYETYLKFLPRVELSSDDRAELDELAAPLRTALQQLGEKIS